MIQYDIENIFNHINWSFTITETGVLGILLLWLWLIWPTKDVVLLSQNKGLQRRFLLALFAVNVLWLFNINLYEQLHVHFLALVILMQMFGWRLASIGVLLPIVFFALFVQKQLGWFAPYAFFSAVLPLFISFVVYSYCFHLLPRNVFVYIFCAGFVNAAIVMTCHLLLWALWLWLTSTYLWTELMERFIHLLPLLVFPEALLNGMAITLLVVYRPGWLYDFRDHQYWTKNR